MKSVRAIDLFAGIGGIRLGFERSVPGLKTVFASEWDAWAQKTYSANFKTPPWRVTSQRSTSEISRLSISVLPVSRARRSQSPEGTWVLRMTTMVNRAARSLPRLFASAASTGPRSFSARTSRGSPITIRAGP